MTRSAETASSFNPLVQKLAVLHRPPLRRPFSVDLEELHAVTQQVLALDSRPENAFIDGAYYWDCCRQDFVARVAQIMAMLPDDPTERHALILERQYAVELQVSFGVPFDPALRRLLSNEGLPLRPPSLFPNADARIVAKIGAITVFVGTVAVTADDFATMVELWHRTNTPMAAKFGSSSRDWDDPDQKELTLRFERFGDYIAVRIDLPLPSTALLREAYRHYVVDDPEWLGTMPDAGALGDPMSADVTVRTWVIGLLVGSGWTFKDAEYVTDEIYRLPSISSVGFAKQRRRLLRRVPEASEFLMQREPKTLK